MAKAAVALRLLIAVFAIAVLVVPLMPLAAATLALDAGEGGDAWTFAKRVDGTIVDGDCDEVVVTSPMGVSRAWRDGARFSATITLKEGVNEVGAVCRNDGEADGVSPVQQWTVHLRDVPKAWVRAIDDRAGLVLDAGRSQRAPVRAAPIIRYEWRADLRNPAPLYAVGGALSLDTAPAATKRLTLRVPESDGEYRVALRITDALGREDTSTIMFRVRDGVARAVDPMREHPAWVDDAIIYGVVPSLFGPNRVDGIIAHLDDIAATGATVLWLAPINDSPAGDFGYAVTDHFRLRATFGDEADLRRLVDAAHARGLRVIMDFVPNHVSARHRYYVDAAAHGAASPYFGFFARDEAGEAAHYFDWTNLKNLNYDNPEVQRYIIEAFAHWVRNVDVDGFRVDVSWGIRERAPEFWRRWREELKRIKPDLLLLAEASARDPYYVTHGFDAAYDWTSKLGEWAWHDAFEDGAHTAAKLRVALAHAEGDAPAGLVFRFLNNNDTGARFITRYGLGRTRVAATMLFTLPGLPSLYTGDEIGAAYEPYKAPPPIAWEDPYGLRQQYRQLAQLRHMSPALRSSALDLIETTQGDTVLAYLRPGQSRADSLLVVLNYDATPVATTLTVDDTLHDFVGAGRFVDVLSGEALKLDSSAPTLTLPAFGVRVLQPAS